MAIKEDRLVLLEGPIRGPNARWAFFCPGCKCGHHVSEGWTQTGTSERPTLSPSILHSSRTGPRCHSFVKDGQIQFLGDCDHALAGQTVDLPPFWSEEEL